MALALSRASKLKAGIRLQQAIQAFESSLTEDEKAEFQSCRALAQISSPTTRDVIQLTANITIKASRRRAGIGGPGLGPRFTSILQLAQQFTAIGDVMVGASQNLIAAGVWSLVRITITSLTAHSVYVEKISELFNAIGRTAPRLQEIALLYARSQKLQSSLAEYMIVFVQLCHHLLQLSKKNSVGQFLSSLKDHQINKAEADLNQWAVDIREEQIFLMGQTIEEVGRGQSALSKIFFGTSRSEERQNMLTERARWINACSAYDHTSNWKRLRKCGTTGLLAQYTPYEDWKKKTRCSTFLCLGILGSGKSVLLANIVEDLNVAANGTADSVAYFFIHPEDPQTLKAENILGSLTRQILETHPDTAWIRKAPELPLRMSCESMAQVLARTLPREQRLIFVVDGTDELLEEEICLLNERLQTLRHYFTVLICASLRIEPSQTSTRDLKGFVPDYTFVMPQMNSDIALYVDSELERRVLSGKLAIRQPKLYSDIRESLLEKADGMFLWVTLQLDHVCTARTDASIREALTDMPRGLAGTFERILGRNREVSAVYQDKILRLVAAAMRPLTVSELSDALSVQPGLKTWSEDLVINDIYRTLGCCGSLVIVDEEDLSVHFVHESVKQYLLSVDERMETPWKFELSTANKALAGITVTYLHVHLDHLADNKKIEIRNSSSTPELVVHNATEQVIDSTLGHLPSPSTTVKKLAKLYFGSKQLRTSHSFSSFLRTQTSRPSSTSTSRGFHLLEYSTSFFMVHCRHLLVSDTIIYPLWHSLALDPTLTSWLDAAESIPSAHVHFTTPNDNKQVSQSVQKSLIWAILNSHHALFDLEYKAHPRIKAMIHVIACVRSACGAKPMPKLDPSMASRLLPFACAGRLPAAVAWLLRNGADPAYMDYCALRFVVADGSYSIARTILAAVMQGNKDTTRQLSSVRDTLVLQATLRPDAPTVRRLLRSCEQPDIWKGVSSSTALSHSLANIRNTTEVSQRGRYVLITYHLLRAGADPRRCFVLRRMQARAILLDMTNIKFFDPDKYLKPTRIELCIYTVFEALRFVYERYRRQIVAWMVLGCFVLALSSGWRSYTTYVGTSLGLWMEITITFSLGYVVYFVSVWCVASVFK